MSWDFVGTSIDHGSKPHLCVELSEAQFDYVQGLIDRLKVRYNLEIKSAVMFALNLADRELKVEEEALQKMGKMIG